MIKNILNNNSKNIAINLFGKEISYFDLNKKINELSTSLTRNVPNDEVIVIDSKKSINKIILILACINSNITYCPIDFSLPEIRIKSMLNSIKKISFIFSEENDFSFDFDYEVKNYVDIMNLNSNFTKFQGSNDILYIMFSSGSTGLPKGIKVSANSIENLIKWHNSSFYSSDEKLITLQYAPLFFDVSIQEILTTLNLGGKLVIFPENKRQDPFYLRDIIKAEKINNLFMPFSTIRLISKIEIEKYDSLNYIFTAGEKVKITDKIKNFFIINNHINLINQYGPTETHVLTSYNLSDNRDKWDILPSIGKLISNVKAKILINDKLEELSSNLNGQLCIKVENIFKGYLNEESNVKVLISDDLGISYYNTGDYIKVNNDLSLEYIERKDNLIKLRGFRIDLDEISSIILKINEIEDYFINFNSDNEIIELYYIGEISEKNLNLVLSKALPNYLIPQNIIKLNEFKFTKTGKIDMKSTISLYQSRINSINKKDELRLIWEASLPENFSYEDEDNFFSIGGDSLRLMDLFNQIEEKFPNRLNFEDLLIDLNFLKLKNMVENE